MEYSRGWDYSNGRVAQVSTPMSRKTSETLRLRSGQAMGHAASRFLLQQCGEAAWNGGMILR